MITVENTMVACGCRSVGECNHNNFAELNAIDKMVDVFSEAMKAKFRKKYLEGYTGWDDKSLRIWIEKKLPEHVGKGDMVDVANLAAMLWNMEQPDK